MQRNKAECGSSRSAVDKMNIEEEEQQSSQVLLTVRAAAERLGSRADLILGIEKKISFALEDRRLTNNLG